MIRPAPDIPVLATERLCLRPPVIGDFDHCAAFYASERSRFEGGPLDRVAAWRIWASDVAMWHLRGYGPWTVVDAVSHEYLGEVGIYHGADYPGPELGWRVTPGAEGRGIASEAARAVLDWLRQTTDWAFVTSIIEPANARSIALAGRVGGVTDTSLPGIDPGDVVIRHDLRAAA